MRRIILGEYSIVEVGELEDRPYLDIVYKGEKLTLRLQHKAAFIKGNHLPRDLHTNFFAYACVPPVPEIRIDRINVTHVSNQLFIQKLTSSGRLLEEIVVTPEDFE